jgi:hypothetical protein
MEVVGGEEKEGGEEMEACLFEQSLNPLVMNEALLLAMVDPRQGVQVGVWVCGCVGVFM